MCFFLLISVSALCFGQEQSKTISRWTYQQLKKVDQLIQQGHHDQAIKKLQALIPKVKKNSYEHAVVLRTLGAHYANQDHYRKAIERLREAIQTQAMPKIQQNEAQYDLVKLYYADAQYHQAMMVLDSWFKAVGNGTVDAYLLKTSIAIQLKAYHTAIIAIKQAIKQSLKPENSWYQTLASLYIEQAEYQQAIAVIKYLIKQRPDEKNYWIQLAGLYQIQKKDNLALAVLENTYQAGLLESESELLHFISLKAHFNMPYQAAQILKKAINSRKVSATEKHWQALANYYLVAKETQLAIESFKQATLIATHGNYEVSVAQLYVNEDQWTQALSYIQQGLSKGKIKHYGQVYLLQGIVHYELNQLAQAESAFKRLSKYNQYQGQAKQWLSYLKR